nr:MAG TPA: hypothetical protein [Caudoviricetes sp.]
MFSLYNSFLARIELKCFLKIIMRRTQRRKLNGCCTTINLLPEMLLLYFYP